MVCFRPQMDSLKKLQMLQFAIIELHIYLGLLDVNLGSLRSHFELFLSL